MAGRADFLVDFQAALQRAAVKLADRTGERPFLRRRNFLSLCRPGVRRGSGEQRAGERQRDHAGHHRRRPASGPGQHVVGDRIRHRPRLFDPAEQRQHDQEIGEVAERQHTAGDHIDAFGRLAAEPAEQDADHDEDPEELLRQRAILRRFGPGAVEPGQERQDQNRAEHRHHAGELVRDRAQDRVERQIVPFRHDVRRRHAGIGRDVVVGVAEIVRHVEDEPGEEQHEAGNPERVLHGRVGRERHGVLFRLRLDARRIVLAGDVQRPDVQHDHAGDHERQQIVQREEPVQRRIADRIAAPQQGDDAVADIGNGGEQVGDDGGAPEAHLAPRQHIAHEAGRHHQEVDDDAEDPQDLARLLV